MNERLVGGVPSAPQEPAMSQSLSMPKQELNLLKLTAAVVAQPGTVPAQIERAQFALNGLSHSRF